MQAHHLIDHRFGDVANDGQSLAISGAVLQQEGRVLARVARATGKIPPQWSEFEILPIQPEGIERRDQCDRLPTFANPD